MHVSCFVSVTQFKVVCHCYSTPHYAIDLSLDTSGVPLSHTQWKHTALISRTWVNIPARLVTNFGSRSEGHVRNLGTYTTACIILPMVFRIRLDIRNTTRFWENEIDFEARERSSSIPGIGKTSFSSLKCRGRIRDPSNLLISGQGTLSSRIKRGVRGVKRTTHLLVTRLISGAAPPLLHMPSWCAQGHLYLCLLYEQGTEKTIWT